LTQTVKPIYRVEVKAAILRSRQSVF